MKTEEILTALRRLKVETGSLVCMGCGREHDCGVHGCRIMRDAADLIEKLTDRCARYAEEIAVLTPEEIERSKLEIEAGCVKAIARTYGIDINRLRKLAEADKDGRYIVMRDAEQEGVARLRELAEADKDGRLVVLPEGPEV